MSDQSLPSKGEINRIGDRIRANDGRIPDPDLPTLRVWRRHHEGIAQEVVAVLANLGYDATPRVKTLNTTVEKLMREPGMLLSRVQDIAGCRIVIPGGLHDQNHVGRRIRRQFDDSRTVDRRTDPSYGYRALHVIVRHHQCFVEVQLRTELQHAWAEAYERLADIWGRGMRYGDDPEDPTRAGLANEMRQLSSNLRYLEELEADGTAYVEGADQTPVDLPKGVVPEDILSELRASRNAVRDKLMDLARVVDSLHTPP